MHKQSGIRLDARIHACTNGSNGHAVKGWPEKMCFWVFVQAAGTREGQLALVSFNLSLCVWQFLARSSRRESKRKYIYGKLERVDMSINSYSIWLQYLTGYWTAIKELSVHFGTVFRTLELYLEFWNCIRNFGTGFGILERSTFDLHNPDQIQPVDLICVESASVSLRFPCCRSFYWIFLLDIIILDSNHSFFVTHDKD